MLNLDAFILFLDSNKFEKPEARIRKCRNEFISIEFDSFSFARYSRAACKTCSGTDALKRNLFLFNIR
jgi:hypothetical protein